MNRCENWTFKRELLNSLAEILLLFLLACNSIGICECYGHAACCFETQSSHGQSVGEELISSTRWTELAEHLKQSFFPALFCVFEPQSCFVAHAGLEFGNFYFRLTSGITDACLHVWWLVSFLTWVFGVCMWDKARLGVFLYHSPPYFVCTWYKCVCMCAHTPQCMCGGQDKTLDVALHLPPCLRQGLFSQLCMPGYLLGILSLHWDTDRCFHAWLYMGSGDSTQVLMVVPYPLSHLPSSSTLFTCERKRGRVCVGLMRVSGFSLHHGGPRLPSLAASQYSEIGSLAESEVCHFG